MDNMRENIEEDPNPKNWLVLNYRFF
jgi:hypothetical protein